MNSARIRRFRRCLDLSPRLLRTNHPILSVIRVVEPVVVLAHPGVAVQEAVAAAVGRAVEPAALVAVARVASSSVNHEIPRLEGD
jgi:hypothetical protein